MSLEVVTWDKVKTSSPDADHNGNNTIRLGIPKGSLIRSHWAHMIHLPESVSHPSG
jgi:hypothetical protein